MSTGPVGHAYAEGEAALGHLETARDLLGRAADGYRSLGVRHLLRRWVDCFDLAGFDPEALAFHEDEPEGSLKIEFILSLIDEEGQVIAVGDQEVEIELDLGGFLEADAVLAVIPARRYVGMRVDFTEIDVQVDRGVIIDGVPIQGPIVIELEDDEVVTVERPIDIVLSEGGRVYVLLDLNARTWLRAIDPDLRTVAERVFADAIRVVTR